MSGLLNGLKVEKRSVVSLSLDLFHLDSWSAKGRETGFFMFVLSATAYSRLTLGLRSAIPDQVSPDRTLRLQGPEQWGMDLVEQPHPRRSGEAISLMPDMNSKALHRSFQSTV